MHSGRLIWSKEANRLSYVFTLHKALKFKDWIKRFAINCTRITCLPVVWWRTSLFCCKSQQSICLGWEAAAFLVTLYCFHHPCARRGTSADAISLTSYKGEQSRAAQLRARLGKGGKMLLSWNIVLSRGTTPGFQSIGSRACWEPCVLFH